MNRRITHVEASDTFWSDLEPLRKEKWYGDLRKSIARFVTDLASGEPVRERGFSNPRMKGIMHLNLPRDMKLFHIYPDSSTLRLCLVADHKIYGFNGKHTGREASTADKIWRAAETPVAVSPFWDTLKWRTPEDIIGNPELREMSFAGLQKLIEEIDQESHDLDKLMRHLKVREIDQIPLDTFGAWADTLVDAQDRVYETIETLAREKRKALQPEDFMEWAEP